MNLDLTILVAAITFIVMLIVLVNLHNKMETIALLLNVMVKKINALEEKKLSGTMLYKIQSCKKLIKKTIMI